MGVGGSIDAVLVSAVITHTNIGHQHTQPHQGELNIVTVNSNIASLFSNLYPLNSNHGILFLKIFVLYHHHNTVHVTPLHCTFRCFT